VELQRERFEGAYCIPIGNERVTGRSKFKSCKYLYVFNVIIESVRTRFECRPEVLLSIRVFWDEKLCYWVSVLRRFENLTSFTFRDKMYS
jgi:hypothetical protein